jgi:hypothetical protein
LGDVRAHDFLERLYLALTTILQGEEEEDEEAEEEFEEAGPAGAQTVPVPATPSAGTKRALDETEEEGEDADQNGGGEDNGAKKAKMA